MTWLALTVRPPWSWAIAHGTKGVENRSGGVGRWRRAMGADGLLIHAGAGWSARGATHPVLARHWWGTAGTPAPQPRLVNMEGGPCTPVPKPDRVAGYLMHPSLLHPDPRARVVHGALVAACRVADVHQAEPECCPEPWAEWSYTDAAGQLRTDVVHLVLVGRRALPHDGVPARGRLGLWHPAPDVVEEITDELGSWPW